MLWPSSLPKLLLLLPSLKSTDPRLLRRIDLDLAINLPSPSVLSAMIARSTWDDNRCENCSLFQVCPDSVAQGAPWDGVDCLFCQDCAAVFSITAVESDSLGPFGMWGHLDGGGDSEAFDPDQVDQQTSLHSDQIVAVLDGIQVVLAIVLQA